MLSCNCPTCGQSLPPDAVAIDWDARIIVAGGRFAALTHQEFEIFSSLYSAKGGVRSKERLLAAIAPLVGEGPEIKIVDVFICRIRQKLGGLGLSIETIWGSGYRLIPISKEAVRD